MVSDFTLYTLIVLFFYENPMHIIGGGGGIFGTQVLGLAVNPTWFRLYTWFESFVDYRFSELSTDVQILIDLQALVIIG